MGRLLFGCLLIVGFLLANFAGEWTKNSTAGGGAPLGLELAESKEELGLQYDVEVLDHNTGRVTLVFTLKDDGRLKPLDSVRLNVPSTEKHEGGGNKVDLSLELALREVDGKLVARVHIEKQLGAKAELHLKTYHLDGKQTPMTWYYHRVPFKNYPARKQDYPIAADAAATSWAGQWKTNWGVMNLETIGDNRLRGTYGTSKHFVEGEFDPEFPHIFNGQWKHRNGNQNGRFQFRMIGKTKFEGAFTHYDRDPSEQVVNWTGEKSD